MLILYYLQTAFTIWMLVDAVRRRADYYWYLLLFVPFGPFAYFFVVKIHDYDLRWLKRLLSFERPPSIDALRYELRQTPSFANRMKLATALHDAGQLAEAAELFEGALETHKDDPEALHGLGRCRLELGEPEAAIAPLVKLCEKNRAYRDYAACLDLADAYAKTGRDDEAIELLEGVVKSSPRMPHHLALAQRLVESGHIERARELLEHALDEHRHSPSFVQRRDKTEARAAAELLTSISPR